jgi:hypothetical protein
MSEELKSITGRIESPNSSTKTSDYFQDELHLTSFQSGNKGQMIQLTLQFNHIQLTRTQAKELVDTLNEWINCFK